MPIRSNTNRNNVMAEENEFTLTFISLSFLQSYLFSLSLRLSMSSPPHSLFLSPPLSFTLRIVQSECLSTFISFPLLYSILLFYIYLCLFLTLPRFSVSVPFPFFFYSLSIYVFPSPSPHSLSLSPPISFSLCFKSLPRGGRPHMTTQQATWSSIRCPGRAGLRQTAHLSSPLRQICGLIDPLIHKIVGLLRAGEGGSWEGMRMEGSGME